MSLADEITDFVRNYFESSAALLTPETDIAVIFGERDPDNFGDFLEDVSKRFGIGHRELRDLTPGADTRPLGLLRFAKDLLFKKIEMEVVCVDHLTIHELFQIVQAGAWPERFIKPSSQT